MQDVLSSVLYRFSAGICNELGVRARNLSVPPVIMSGPIIWTALIVLVRGAILCAFSFKEATHVGCDV